MTSTPGKTTTILGAYARDTKYIIEELGNAKSLDFGPRDGGFNLLNTPDELYVSPNQFWKEYNKPWLDNAIQRNDIILMATKIEESSLFITSGELTGYGREYFYLISKNYEYIDGKMVSKGVR